MLPKEGIGWDIDQTLEQQAWHQRRVGLVNDVVGVTRGLRKIPEEKDIPLTAHMSVLGNPGFTAYGGSQYLNSEATGLYGDHILYEDCKAYQAWTQHWMAVVAPRSVLN